MTMARTSPYGAQNFQVDIKGGRDPVTPLGGFSDVSGLGAELTIAEYRNGNDPENHVRKVPMLHKVSDVTLKRGIVNSSDLWEWIDDTHRTGLAAQREVTITLNDEAGKRIQTWVLRGCVPMKYTGPTLAGKGGGDVAMEELTLSCEAISFKYEQTGS